MEEKVLIKSSPSIHRKLFVIIIIAIALAAIIVPTIMLFALPVDVDGQTVWGMAKEAYDAAIYEQREGLCYHVTIWDGAILEDVVFCTPKMWTCPLNWSSPASFAFAFSQDVFDELYGVGYYTCIGAGLALSLVLTLIYLWLRCYELVVTDKRVYGRAAFGKRVDLPMDSISAVGTMWLRGISVATSSGKIGFLLMRNRNDIHKCISDMLINRQPTKVEPVVVPQVQTPQGNADELRKYKTLLDDGIITEEEFNAKKKQLLGL